MKEEEIKKMSYEAYKRYVLLIKKIELEIKNSKLKNEKQIREFLFKRINLKKLKKS